MRKESSGVRNGWEALYDFLNDIFATMIPGTFFLSFFVIFFVSVFDNEWTIKLYQFAQSMGLVFTAMIGAVAYCFGAIFQRQEIKKVDAQSARYLYCKTPHDSGHSFAFANALTSSYVQYIFVLLKSIIILFISKEDQGTFIKRAANQLENEVNSGSLKYLKSFMPNGTKELCEYAARKYFAVLKSAMPDMPKERTIEKDPEENLNKLEEDLKKWGYLSFRQLSDQIFCRFVNNKFNSILKSQCSSVNSCPFQIDSSEPMQPESILNFWGIKKSRIKWELFRHRLKGIGNQNYVYLTLLIRHLKKHPLQFAKRPHVSSDKKDFYVLLHKIIEYLDSDLNGSVDWPYTHMYSYCVDRGLPFADKVNWGDGALRPLSPLDRVGLSTIHSYADEINRSKSRMNTLKMELSREDESLHRTISKTEAHIRFINSIWHAKKLLLIVLKTALVLTLTYILVDAFVLNRQQYTSFLIWLRLFPSHNFLQAIIICLVYLAICRYIHISTLEIMHYQRVRELTMILKAQSLCESS